MSLLRYSNATSYWASPSNFIQGTFHKHSCNSSSWQPDKFSRRKRRKNLIDIHIDDNISRTRARARNWSSGQNTYSFVGSLIEETICKSFSNSCFLVSRHAKIVNLEKTSKLLSNFACFILLYSHKTVVSKDLIWFFHPLFPSRSHSEREVAYIKLLYIIPLLLSDFPDNHRPVEN